MSLTLSAKLERFSPVACRLLARRKTGGGSHTVDLSDEEIAKRSGLRVYDVKCISWAESWVGIPVDKMLAFTKGCGINLDDRVSLRQHWVMLRDGSARHVRNSPRWEQVYKPLFIHWAKTMRKK
jgi:hypothetical protein